MPDRAGEGGAKTYGILNRMRASTAPIVKTPVFEGPLDLLISLIEERKLLVNDIALATVTDEYVARISALGELPLGEASEFVALAATLLLIKSRSLLPSLPLTEEEDADIKELEYRLLLYQIIRDGARKLQPSLGGPVLWEGIPPQPSPIFVPHAGITIGALREAAHRMLSEFPKPLALSSVAVKKAVTLEETIERLAGRVSSAISVSFHEFAGALAGQEGKPVAHDRARKYEIVVSFLALLELVKRGILKATQGEHFGDITVEQDGAAVPIY